MKHHYTVIQFLSISDFIMVIYVMHSYAQVFNARQTRPYFSGCLKAHK